MRMARDPFIPAMLTTGINSMQPATLTADVSLAQAHAATAMAYS